MSNSERQITLKHLYIENKKMIGIKFYPDKVLQALIKQLPNVKWSETYGMVVIPNTEKHLDTIFETFKGICWINCTQFFPNRPVNTYNKELSVDSFRRRKRKNNWRYCPEEFYIKLEIRKYSLNTSFNFCVA